jgi:hypothetical protein
MIAMSKAGPFVHNTTLVQVTTGRNQTTIDRIKRVNFERGSRGGR